MYAHQDGKAKGSLIFPLWPPSAKAQIAEPGKFEVCVNTLFPRSPMFGVSLTKVWLRILKGWSCVAVESISALVSGEKWSIHLLWDISVASPLRFCRRCFANTDQGAWLHTPFSSGTNCISSDLRGLVRAIPYARNSCLQFPAQISLL